MIPRRGGSDASIPVSNCVTCSCSRYIGPSHPHGRARLLQFIQLRARRLGGSAAARQDQVPGSVLDQPRGRQQTQAAEAAGNKIGAVGAEQRFLLDRRGLVRNSASAGPHNEPET